MTTEPYILLVDDEPHNLFLLEELLQEEGYHTQSVSSGEMALQMARQARPLLILLDVMMPMMDGFEVCRQLRADADLQTVPILFLTALDDESSRLKGLQLMGDDYLTKPIQIDLVLTKISSMLRLQQLRQESHQRQLSQATQQIQQQAREQSERQTMAAWQISETLSEKFRLFVPDQFLRRIAPMGVESIQLGNATTSDMTVLFCDIREFTAIAESQQAQETFAWLNAFFASINQAVVDHAGFIDKYLGDAVMAVFDRPEHHAEDALNAAVAIRQALVSFNQTRTQFNLPDPVNIGIGLHTGQGVIGTLGSSDRMDPTVIGDVVNTASRLEELTKVYGCQVIASGYVLEQLPPDHPFYLRWIDRLAPRGKRQVSDLYEVLGTETCVMDEAKLRSRDRFEQGTQAWQQQDITTALTYFEQVLDLDPNDTIAALYCDRCRQCLNPQTQTLIPFPPSMVLGYQWPLVQAQWSPNLILPPLNPEY